MKRILPYLKPYRGKMLLGMLLIAVSSVCSLLLPTIMSDILDGGIYTSDWDYILRCCGRMLLVTLLSLGRWRPVPGAAPKLFPASAPTCARRFLAA